MKTVVKLLAAMTVMVMAACGSSPSSKADDLDAAIRDASNYLNSNVPKGSKIVILNIQSSSSDLSDYIIDELITNAVNDKIFSVVDRRQLDAIRAEQNFQFSREVDDKSAMAIGKFFGAQSIVSRALNKLGSGYRMRIRALEVQTAQVLGQYKRNIVSSAMIAALMDNSPSDAASTAKIYKVGDIGPASGLIFFDKGNNSDGWRYLEAAPVDAEFRAKWSMHGTDVENTQETVGSGRRNTQLIVEKFKKTSEERDTAAQKCDDLVFGGFDDWFLPSKAELDLMYGNLKRRNLGAFKENADGYLSSSLNGRNLAYQLFSDGSIKSWGIGYGYSGYVRPVRQVVGP